MRLKNVKLARSIWLFDLQDMNPRGKDIGDDLLHWINTSYAFTVAPDTRGMLAARNAQPSTDAQPSPPTAIFERGHFQKRPDVSVEITKLSVYNDGIVIDTSSSTDDGDSFAGNLLESVSREFGLTYEEDTVRKRLYLSELIVRSDIAFDTVNAQLTAFARRISEQFGQLCQLSALHFWTEPNDSGKHKSFTIERQAGKAFAEQRYYSQAPLQTEVHLQLLKELEQILVS